MTDGERYFLRMDDAPWQEVTEQQWRTQERACGFRLTRLQRQVDLLRAAPTSGFSAGGVQGRIYFAGEPIPADVLPPVPVEPEAEQVEYRWFTRIAAHEDEGRQYAEELMPVSVETARVYDQTPEHLARWRAAYWRDRLGPEVKVDVLRQRVVTYPKEVVDD